MYYSCEWIEYKMCVDLNRLTFCCKPYGENKGFIPICDFNGGALPIDIVLRRRDELREQNNSSSENYPCKGCPLLLKRQWDQLPNGVYFNQINISNSILCNLECTYCYTVIHKDWYSAIKPYDLKPVLLDVVAKGYMVEGGRLEWAGGEPTILPGFNELFDTFLKKGCVQTVFTNAVVFSEAVEDALKQQKASVVTSVDCGTPETYLKIKGKDHFNNVWANLLRYNNAGGAVVVKYIINRHTSSDTDVHQFIALCIKNNVKFISITCDMNEIHDDSISDETLLAAATMATEAKNNNLKFEIRYDDFTEKHAGKLTRYLHEKERNIRPLTMMSQLRNLLSL